MKPFPKKALPILEAIRKEVKRPRSLPKEDEFSLRWHKKYCAKSVFLKSRCCPMGMLPGSKSSVPSFETSWTLERFSPLQILAFARWFDSHSQMHAPELMNFIWPPME